MAVALLLGVQLKNIMTHYKLLVVLVYRSNDIKLSSVQHSIIVNNDKMQVIAFFITRAEQSTNYSE